MGVLAQLAAEAETAAAWRHEFRRLLGLLVQIQRGELDPAAVKVDLVNDSWSVAPAGGDAKGEPQPGQG